MVLDGRAKDVTDDLGADMDRAAEQLDFERAAMLRDQLAALNRRPGAPGRDARTRGRRYRRDRGRGAGRRLLRRAHVRPRRPVSARSTFHPRAPISDAPEVLAASSPSTTSSATRRPRIYLSHADRGRGHARGIAVGAFGPDRSGSARRAAATRALGRARAQNAANALRMREATEASLAEQFEELRHFLGIAQPLARIECFDVSHTMGEATVASCVVFGPEGPIKAEYRRFNIETSSAATTTAPCARRCCAAIARRRRRSAAAGPAAHRRRQGPARAGDAACSRNSSSHVPAVAASRKARIGEPGRSALSWRAMRRPLYCRRTRQALHLIQRMRDEAHRFAITGHRRKRARSRADVDAGGDRGPRARRRRELLRHFGGLQGVLRAGSRTSAKVHGISRRWRRRSTSICIRERDERSFHDPEPADRHPHRADPGDRRAVLPAVSLVATSACGDRLRRWSASPTALRRLPGAQLGSLARSARSSIRSPTS